jgi:hypothetical protein
MSAAGTALLFVAALLLKETYQVRGKHAEFREISAN